VDEELRQLVREQRDQLTALQRPGSAQGHCTVVSTLSAQDAAALRADLARLVDERLGGAKAQPAPANTRKIEVEEPSSDAVAATAEAYRVIDQAVSARHWTEREAESFRQLLPKLTGEQRQEVTQRLTLAINEGRMSVSTLGPPY
jgi:hypothetical protein